MAELIQRAEDRANFNNVFNVGNPSKMYDKDTMDPIR